MRTTGGGNPRTGPHEANKPIARHAKNNLPHHLHPGNLQSMGGLTAGWPGTTSMDTRDMHGDVGALQTYREDIATYGGNVRMSKCPGRRDEEH